MSQPSSLHIKILSLAVVVWGLMSGMSLSLQGAAWVPWLALVMLMLLEAYSGDAKPASWSRWSAGLTQLLSPGMLPYYAVLILSLALGPDQMHRGDRGIPHVGPTLPKPPTSLPIRSENRQLPPSTLPNTVGPTQSARPPGFPGGKFQRPGTVPPGANVSTVPAPGANAPQPQVKPVVPSTAGPAIPSSVRTPVLPPTAGPGSAALSPTSTAKPQAAPAGTK